MELTISTPRPASISSAPLSDLAANNQEIQTLQLEQKGCIQNFDGVWVESVEPHSPTVVTFTANDIAPIRCPSGQTAHYLDCPLFTGVVSQPSTR